MITLDDLRTAHAEGFTFGGYADDNKSIVTGGSDGDLRIYPGLYDEETASISIGTKITCLAVEGNLVVAANDAHEVKSYTLPSLQLENVLLRFTASVNHVHISNDKKYVGAASSDFMIKTVNLDGTNQKTYTGHEAPVLCLYIGNTTMVSSSCDGSVRIWNLDNQECTKTLDMLPKSNSIPDNVSWFSMTEKSEKDLAVPCDQSIKIISSDSWLEKNSLEEHHAVVSVVKWSPCGKYLATAAINGEIFGWDMATKKCFAKFQHHQSKGITSLTWNKKNKGEILFAGIEGEFGYCKMPLEQEAKPEEDAHDMLLDDIDMGDDINIDDEIDMGANDDVDDDEMIKPSSDKKQKKRLIQIDDEEEEEDDDIMPSLSKKQRVNNVDSLLDDHAEVDNDVDGDDKDVYADKDDVYADKDDVYADKDDVYDKDVYDIENEDNYDDNNSTMSLIKEGLIAAAKPPEDEDSLSSFVDKPPPEKPIQPVEMKLQDPFQPSSTPSNLMHRYMLWNSVGIIRCHVEDDVSYIDVEFHDASTYHPLHIPNVLNHSMAALSDTALVFACESDDSMPSKLACTHFGSWDSNKDWDVSMPDGESIEAIAANNTNIVVATSKRFLRIYTISGTQTQLITLHGPVVSMTIHEKQLMVIYHKSGGFKDCHCFGILQLHLRKNVWKVISDAAFVSKPKSTLSWIGFSSEGTPVLVESAGDVLLFHRQQVSWIPIANTKQQLKNRSDNYWIIGVEEDKKQIRCIYCKGANFPTTLPRPVPTLIPFQIPLCEIITEKSMKEEELIKCNLTSSNIKYNKNTLSTRVEVELQDVERQQIRLLMQLFALACKSEQEFRAVEICNLMPNAECIGMAIQYASKLRRMHLAQKLTELARKRAATEEEEEEEEEQGEDEDQDEEEEEDLYDEDEMIEDDGYEESEKESQEVNRRNAIQSSGPKMAVIGRKSNSSRQSVEVKDEEDNSQSSQLSRDGNEKEVTASADTKRPSLSSGNPFKMNNKSASDAASRGTDYFATLPSQHLTKKAKNKAEEKSSNKSKIDPIADKKAKSKKTSTISFSTTNRKKTMEPQKGGENNGSKNSDKNNEENIAEKKPESTPKLSGFQMFLEKQKENNADNEENIVPKVMRQWKELSADDKKEWNEKAKGQSDDIKTDKILTSKEDNKMTEIKKSGTNVDNLNNGDNDDKIGESTTVKDVKVSKENKVSQIKKTQNGKLSKDSKPPDAKKISEVKNASRQKLAAFSFQQK